MKTLVQYILEQFENSKINEAVDIYRLTEVIATFFVQPNEIVLQAPETYSESDIQIYIGDKWLNDLPSGQDHAKKLFGVNSDSINDAYFEYDTFEHIDLEPKEYIEWESKYDSKTSNNDDVKLDYFRLKNIKYIISFDRFDLTDVDDDTVEDKLVEIFEAAQSNYDNKYPIEIQFDKDSLKYRK